MTTRSPPNSKRSSNIRSTDLGAQADFDSDMRKYQEMSKNLHAFRPETISKDDVHSATSHANHSASNQDVSVLNDSQKLDFLCNELMGLRTEVNASNLRFDAFFGKFNELEA